MNILVADDDKTLLMMVENTLRKEGHNVVTAADGQEALDKATAQKFDLIITDILMPKKEGIELISDLRDAQPNIKIIAISSDQSAGYTMVLRIAETVGADVTLKKPFTRNALLEAIAKAYPPA